MKKRIWIFILLAVTTCLSSFGEWQLISFSNNIDKKRSRKMVMQALSQGDTVRFFKQNSNIYIELWEDSAFFHVIKSMVPVDSVIYNSCRSGDGPRRIEAKSLYHRKEITDNIWELALIENPSNHFFSNMAIQEDTISKSGCDGISLSFSSPKIDIPIIYIIELQDGSLYSTDHRTAEHQIFIPRRKAKIKKIYAKPFGLFYDIDFVSLNAYPNLISYESDILIDSNTIITFPEANNEDLIKTTIPKITLYFSGFWLKTNITDGSLYPDLKDE